MVLYVLFILTQYLIVAELCEESIGFKGAEELWKKSAEVLCRGLESFEKVKDVANVALLLSNTGRLMRLCAFHSVPKDEPRQFVNPERLYYEQVFFLCT